MPYARPQARPCRTCGVVFDPRASGARTGRPRDRCPSHWRRRERGPFRHVTRMCACGERFDPWQGRNRTHLGRPFKFCRACRAYPKAKKRWVATAREKREKLRAAGPPKGGRRRAR